MKSSALAFFLFRDFRGLDIAEVCRCCASIGGTQARPRACRGGACLACEAEIPCDGRRSYLIKMQANRRTPASFSRVTYEGGTFHAVSFPKADVVAP